MAISYVVLKLSRIFERGAESAPPSGARVKFIYQSLRLATKNTIVFFPRSSNSLRTKSARLSILLRIFLQVRSAGSCSFNPGREHSGSLQIYSDDQGTITLSLTPEHHHHSEVRTTQGHSHYWTADAGAGSLYGSPDHLQNIPNHSREFGNTLQASISGLLQTTRDFTGSCSTFPECSELRSWQKLRDYWMTQS